MFYKQTEKYIQGDSIYEGKLESDGRDTQVLHSRCRFTSHG